MKSAKFFSISCLKIRLELLLLYLMQSLCCLGSLILIAFSVYSCPVLTSNTAKVGNAGWVNSGDL